MLQDELSEFEHHNMSLAESPDPELVKFPAPRHPWRRVTIFTLLLCFGISLALLLELRSELGYALRPGPPQSVGALAALSPGHPISNHWVQAEADLEDHRRYSLCASL